MSAHHSLVIGGCCWSRRLLLHSSIVHSTSPSAIVAPAHTSATILTPCLMAATSPILGTTTPLVTTSAASGPLVAVLPLDLFEGQIENLWWNRVIWLS